jgi:hypothetical protein
VNDFTEKHTPENNSDTNATFASLEFPDGRPATTTTPTPAAATTDSTPTRPAAATAEHDELSDAEQSPGRHESTAANDADRSST